MHTERFCILVGCICWKLVMMEVACAVFNNRFMEVFFFRWRLPVLELTIDIFSLITDFAQVTWCTGGTGGAREMLARTQNCNRI